MEAKFIETIRQGHLYQHLFQQTRNKSTDNSLLIDLGLTYKVMQVSDTEYHGLIGKSNDCVFIFEYDCYLDSSQPKKRCLP